MRKNILILILLIHSLCHLNAGSVLIVMGPSCVGKSTTIKTLTQQLGSAWKIVDFDKIEIASKAACKKENDESIFKQVIQNANDILFTNDNVIIDTNVYFAQHENFLNNTKVQHLLLHAPLDILIKRDQNRSRIIGRTEIRAQYAHDYVIESFERFFYNPNQSDYLQNSQPQAKVAYDCLLSTNSNSFENDLLEFIQHILNNN